jgi:transmembrane sensor
MDASQLSPISEQLLVRYIFNQTSEAESEQVLQWCKLHQENQAYLNNLTKIWETSLVLTPDLVPDVEASLERLKNKARKEQINKMPARLHANWRWLAVAAAAVCVPVLVWYYTMSGFYQPAAPETAQTVSGSRTLLLADGSEITMNKNSLVQYDKTFDKNTRNVSLQKGEVFFKVKPDPDKPFIVRVNEVEIRVLGTSFNVKSSHGRTEVIVETGKVQVTRAGEVLNLLPEEKAVIPAQTPGLLKQKNQDLLYQYYRTHAFVARDTPLWRMVEVLNEAYDVRIVIGSESIRNMPLNITFKDEPVDEILAVVARTFNLTIQRSGNQILLR